MRKSAIGIVPALMLGIAIMITGGAPWPMPLLNLGAALVGFVVLGLGLLSLEPPQRRTAGLRRKQQ